MLKKLLLSLAILASVFLAQVLPVVHAQTVTDQIQNGLCSGSNLQVSTSPAPNSCSSANSGTQQFNNILHHIVNVLSAIVGVVAVVMIIVGGFRYVTSGGNDTSITSARNTILYAIIGLIVVALAQIIVHFVLNNLVNA